MADGTHIEWTDATVNAINGCSVVSPGCTHCYAMRLAGTRLRGHPTRAGLTTDSKAGPVWNGEVRLNEAALLQPLRWRRSRRIFWNAHGDMFHPAVPDEWIDRCFAVMALTPQHIHQVLTKRSERMRSYVTEWHARRKAQPDMGLPGRTDDLLMLADLSDENAHVANAAYGYRNIWLGVSVEDQKRANERIPDLLNTPAAVRWVSCEPLLGEIDLRWIEFPNERGGTECWNALDLLGLPVDSPGCQSVLDWVVVGGESGPGSRPMDASWARSLRDQCAEANVPFFFKQWGDWAPSSSPEATIAVPPQRRDFIDSPGWQAAMIRVGKRSAGRLLDGIQHNDMPA